MYKTRNASFFFFFFCNFTAHLLCRVTIYHTLFSPICRHSSTDAFPKELCNPEHLTHAELASLHQDIIKVPGYLGWACMTWHEQVRYIYDNTQYNLKKNKTKQNKTKHAQIEQSQSWSNSNNWCIGNPLKSTSIPKSRNDDKERCILTAWSTDMLRTCHLPTTKSITDK